MFQAPAHSQQRSQPPAPSGLAIAGPMPGAPPSRQPPAPPGGGRNYTGRSTIRTPQYIDINTTEDAVNNMMASGFQSADTHYQQKRQDRQGLSRGAASRFIAGQEGVQAMNAAAEQAAGVRAQDQKTNAQMKSDYEKAREMDAQNQSMIQHSLSQSNWARAFANQSAQAQLRMAHQQAQLQLMLAMMRK